MKKNGWDPKTPDFIWNKNRLVMEKEALKMNLMKVINSKPKKAEEEAGEEIRSPGEPAPIKIDKKSPAINQANQILNSRKEGEVKRGTEVKPTATAGAGIVSGNKQGYSDV
jgi:hypothetical protein